MSVDRCFKCDAFVDTDNEPEAYVETGNMRSQTELVCLCRWCRERYEEELERQESEPRSMPSDWQPTADQQAIMDRISAEHDEEGIEP